MNELRLVLLLIGALVLGGIYYFGTRKKPDQAQETEPPVSAGNKPAKKEPALGGLFAGKSKRAASASSGDNPAPGQDEKAGVSIYPPQPEKIVTLYIHAQGDKLLSWHAIKEAAEKAGLEYGKDNLFYRYRDTGSSKEMLFLVANMLKPGIFTADTQTRGLVLVMTLPGPVSALDSWETLLPVGQRLAELLGGTLTDEHHNAMSRQQIAFLREQMREFDRARAVKT
jgi:cell division protein ZipA